MADNRKEQERAELHRAIWAIADDLRGAVDGWDFKSYVLGAMFYRYISENFAAYINAGEIEAGNTSFDYAKMPDAEAEEARAGLFNYFDVSELRTRLSKVGKTEINKVYNPTSAENKNCKYMIDNNFIDCFIQLPSDLLFDISN